MLLLDEPTNHLDAESVAWLQRFLHDFPGTVVTITHDRYFLDEVAGWILELDRGQGIPYQGNYSGWLEQKQKRLEQEGRAEDSRVKSLSRELEWVRSAPKARQSKSKARLNAYEKLLEQDREQRNETTKIAIPAGPRLGDIVIEADGLEKGFGEKLLFEGVDFRLPPGGIVGVIGPNGAGKSTLFNIIIGKIFPDLGEIKFHGEVINELPIHKRALKGISLLEQSKGLFGKLSVYDNLYAILELHMEDKNKIDIKITQLLNYFGLYYLKDTLANNMSGGETKKVSMLQRVCNRDISLLLLDEPLAALDPLSITSIKKFILELRSMGISIIITDHNFFAIQDILDNCLIIRDGNVMVEGPPRTIMKDEKAIKYYLGTGFKI
jgi:LPS export ABC transporter ATP-binding protein